MAKNKSKSVTKKGKRNSGDNKQCPHCFKMIKRERMHWRFSVDCRNKSMNVNQNTPSSVVITSISCNNNKSDSNNNPNTTDAHLSSSNNNPSDSMAFSQQNENINDTFDMSSGNTNNNPTNSSNEDESSIYESNTNYDIMEESNESTLFQSVYPNNTINSNDEGGVPTDLSRLSKNMLIFNKSPTFSQQQLMSIVLFKLLHKVNAPISLYNDLSQFIDIFSNVIRNNYTSKCIIPRDRLVRDMHHIIFNKSSSSCYDSSKNKEDDPLESQTTLEKYSFNLYPTSVKVNLSNCSTKVDVPRFDFVSSFFSIIHDTSLMKKENLLYNETSYITPSRETISALPYDDIHTGMWYEMTHKEMISDPSKEILCPIILYIDGVPVDSVGRKSLEPVSFTIGFLNRSTRNKPSAWKLLGYIPNIEKCSKLKYKDKFKSSASVAKKRHYHEVLKTILEPLKNVQSNGGIKLTLPFIDAGHYGTRVVKFPIMFIIGDTLGNDKLCSRLHNYKFTKSQVTGVSRDCNCCFKHSDRYNFKCHPISRKILFDLEPKIVKRLGFNTDFFNAFDEMNLGYSPMGINGHTPVEMLHQWYLGVVSNTISYFLDRLTPKAKDYLDRVCQSISQNYNRQSDRVMPSINAFKIGIDKLKLTGSEKGNQLFMIWISMLQLNTKSKLILLEDKSPKKFRYVTRTLPNGNVQKQRIHLKKILDTNQKYNKWISLIETMLSVTEWLSCSFNAIDRNDITPSVNTELYVMDGFKEWQDSKIYNNITTLDANSQSSLQLTTIDEDNIDEFGYVDDEVCPINLDGNEALNTNIDMNVDDNEVVDIEEVDEEHISSDLPISNQGYNVSNMTNEQYQKKCKDDESFFGDALQFPMRKKSICISKSEFAMRCFMKELYHSIYAEDKDVLKTSRQHSTTHYDPYITLYSSPANFNGNVPESMNKELAKKVGKRTQQRFETINKQAAERFAENNIIRTTFNIASFSNQFRCFPGIKKLLDDVGGDCVDTQNSTEMDDLSSINYSQIQAKSPISVQFVVDNAYQMNTYIHCRKIEIQYDQIPNNQTNLLLKSHENGFSLQNEQLQIVIHTLFNNNVLKKQWFVQQAQTNTPTTTGTVNMFPGITLISHLSMGSNFMVHSAYRYYDDTMWFDWVNIDWGDGHGNLPGRILGILDAQKLLEDLVKSFDISRDELELLIDSDDLISCQYWCVVQSSDKSYNPPSFVSNLSTMYRLEKRTRLIAVTSIAESAYVIPDINIDNTQNESQHQSMNGTFMNNADLNYISINCRESWSTHFMRKCDYSSNI